MTSIKGFSTLVVQDYAARMPTDALDLIQDVRTAADRMEQLIDDLLAFARLAQHNDSRNSQWTSTASSAMY